MVGRGREKGVRNKFKQVLLIEGHPDILYTHNMRSMAILNIGEQTFNIGAVSKDLYEHLRKIPGSELVISEKQIERTVGVEGFIGLHVRKSGENTTIEKTLTDDILNSKGSRKKQGVRSEDKIKKTKELRTMVAAMGIK